MSFIKEVKTYHGGGKTWKETTYNEPKKIKLDNRDYSACQIICCDKCLTREGEIARVVHYTLTGGVVGALIGAPALGVGAAPGFGIGCAAGFVAALIKIACDQ